MIAKRKEDRVKIYAGYGRIGVDRVNLTVMTQRELLELYDAVSAEITRRDLENDGLDVCG